MKAAPGAELAAFRDDPAKYRGAAMLLEEINRTRRALQVGTYTERPQYDRWDVVNLAPHAMRFTSSPTYIYFRGVNLPSFAVGTAAEGSFVIPTSYNPDGGLWPAIRFGWGASPVASEVVTWLLTVVAAPRDGIFPASAKTYSVPYTITGNEAGYNTTVRLGAFPAMTRPGDTVLVGITRGGAATTQNPFLLGIDFAHQKGPFGAEEKP